MHEVKFDKKCPNCSGEMAETNTFCCLKCYEIAKMKENKSK